MNLKYLLENTGKEIIYLYLLKNRNDEYTVKGIVTDMGSWIGKLRSVGKFGSGAKPSSPVVPAE